MVAQMKLMIAEEEKFPGKALSLSHTKTAISTIKEKFSEQQLQRFEESCFGHLLLIEDLKWTSPIVHGLLLRKADPKTVSQLNGIKFIVGNKVIQFTAQQFCIVTGLRFGNLPFIPIPTNENCSLKRKYFGNDKIVNLLELEKAFLECADADDLAEDLEEFGKYPWGAVCYAKTNASLLRALCADYQQVKVPKKAGKTKKYEKKAKTTATGRPREYHLKGFAYALQVDVQLLRPSVIDKQQPYWTWGDSVDDTEEFVELLGDDADLKTSTFASVEEKDKDIDETASLPSSSKGTVASRELRTLKRDFERTKNELAKVALSNRALRDRVHQLEDKVRKESMKGEKEFEKNKKCVEDFRNTLASMEHYFKLEIEQLKKQNGGVNEAGEGHEDLGSPHMNEGGNNDLSPLHAYVGPPTEPAVMETQVPGDGAEPSAAMVVEEAEMAVSVPHLQVHEAAEQAQSEKLPTPEDVAGCDEICQRVLPLLEDWKITKSMPSGGSMNPPSLPTVTMAGDEEGSSTVEKKEVEGKGCRQKRPAQTLLSPFTDPLRKKRTMSVSAATATQYFDPSKSLPIEDVKVVIEFCTAWKSDIRLVDETEWISSRHLDIATFLIRKRQLSHPLVFGTDWTMANCCLQQFLEPFKPTAKKRGSKKAAASNTVDLPPSKLKNIHYFVRGTWQHGHTATVYDSYVAFTKCSKLVTLLHPISDTLARVLYDMHFYEDSEVEEVKQKGLKMSMFTPFSVCSIVDVPQQRDGTSCGILTVKFIEHLSAGISVDKVDPLKIKYYRLKLAIEVILLFCLALCCYLNLEPDTVFTDLNWSRYQSLLFHLAYWISFLVYLAVFDLSDCSLSTRYTSTIRRKNGKLSELIDELQGLKFSDLMYVTKHSMNAAVSKLHKLLESVTEAIALQMNIGLNSGTALHKWLHLHLTQLFLQVGLNQVLIAIFQTR
ncbi:hypothetical protein L3X38_023462 [Prunus dulcis]|uniref:Ubiquitin-like protease family profile domain-containing protein n=1 Tax=Prunus dulcis TaxID=3755 RepID=A0AAD4W0H5_PRUDU|nr:hypothetical protein L3X38_023462 [Prunus dulcis]